jgi:hypothetical protein
MQGSGWVIHGEVDYTALLSPRAMNPADALPGEEPSQGVASQGGNYLGRDELDLTVKPPLASLDFIGQGVSIPLGTALNHVADIDLAPFEPDGRE